MGTPDCRRYALEQLSDNNRQPIMKWLEELESERLSYIEEVRVILVRSSLIASRSNR